MAYNEEANIAETLRFILEGCRNIESVIKVYANGCTDDTHQIVKEISIRYPSVDLIEISKASKANAWNIAFKENKNEVLIFSDGDIAPDSDAIRKILKVFDTCSNIEIACCELWPSSKGLNWEQHLTGFMQIPLKQDFLLGAFYGIRRSAFITHFQRCAIPGLPVGVIGDDVFLDDLVARDKFVLVNSRVTYRPPVIKDYYKYLARVQWQNEQIRQVFNAGNITSGAHESVSLPNTIMKKIVGSRSVFRFMMGSVTTITRMVFKMVVKTEVQNEYKKLGPVTDDGDRILSDVTRSTSVK